MNQKIKTFNGKSSNFLNFWEEEEGLLKDVEKKDDKLILTFETYSNLFLPYSKNLEEQLQKVVGRKVGVLRTDFVENPYRVRVENRNSDRIKKGE